MAKKITYKSAAIAVLENAERPMHLREILRLAMEKHGLKTKAKKPHKIIMEVLLSNKDVFKWEFKAHFSLVGRNTSIAEELGKTPKSISMGFEKINEKLKEIGFDTEEKAVIARRVGQNYFREGLLIYWDQRCPLTDVTNLAFLVSSHIVPWSRDETIRLDLFNGLLLSPFWDKAFDQGLVTFNCDGSPKFSSRLTNNEIRCLAWDNRIIPLDDKHKENLLWHQKKKFIE